MAPGARVVQLFARGFCNTRFDVADARVRVDISQMITVRRACQIGAKILARSGVKGAASWWLPKIAGGGLRLRLWRAHVRAVCTRCRRGKDGTYVFVPHF